MVADWACSVGVTLVEIPTTAPAYALNATVTRFPSQALKDALLSQVQQVISMPARSSRSRPRMASTS
jgi:hypothetical protein